jgi:hypothetical protein
VLISGRVLILSFYADFELLPSFELFLALLYHFTCLCHFSYRLLVFTVFLLLDDILELLLAFWVF